MLHRVGSCEHGNGPSGSIKGGKFLDCFEWLLASKEENSSVRLVMLWILLAAMLKMVKNFASVPWCVLNVVVLCSDSFVMNCANRCWNDHAPYHCAVPLGSSHAMRDVYQWQCSAAKCYCLARGPFPTLLFRLHPFFVCACVRVCVNPGGRKLLYVEAQNWNDGFYARIEVFTAVKIQVDVFWVETPYSVAVAWGSFEGPCCLHLNPRS